ncbi:MAG: hypothetical protein EA398_06585 [Deltaproteobacteria bacterium]|nr:MAG: hypothetical protein EA398_06585 [Deltaproteobacteria bacterium]
MTSSVLFAFLSSDPTLDRYAPALFRSGLAAPVGHPDSSAPWALGMAWTQQQRGLVRRQPRLASMSPDIAALLVDTPGRSALGGLFRHGPSAASETSPPYRSRDWVFVAHPDERSDEDRDRREAATAPPGLLAQREGNARTERRFLTVVRALREVRRTGQPETVHRNLLEGLARAMQLLPSAEKGDATADDDAPPLDVLLTDGEVLLAHAHRRPIHWKLQKGLHERDLPAVDGLSLDRVGNRPRYRAVALQQGCDHAPGWSSIRPGQSILVTREADVLVHDPQTGPSPG